MQPAWWIQTLLLWCNSANHWTTPPIERKESALSKLTVSLSESSSMAAVFVHGYPVQTACTRAPAISAWTSCEVCRKFCKTWLRATLSSLPKWNSNLRDPADITEARVFGSESSLWQSDVKLLVMLEAKQRSKRRWCFCPRDLVCLSSHYMKKPTHKHALFADYFTRASLLVPFMIISLPLQHHKPLWSTGCWTKP